MHPDWLDCILGVVGNEKADSSQTIIEMKKTRMVRTQPL
jgi:hypothetical protein